MKREDAGALQPRISHAEWQTRVDLAACYRLVAKYCMSDLIYNHITACVPDEDDRFLINPFGLMYEEVTASSLVKIDLQGRIIDHTSDLPYGINHAGYVIHGAIHAARHDVQCIVHTHTRAGMAVSVMACGLLPATQTAMRFHNRLAYHDFEGPALYEDERQRLLANLGNNDAMIMRNHGLLVCGRSVPEAFLLMQRLESACKVQVDFMAANTALHMPSQQSIEKTAFVLAPPTVAGREGADARLGDWDGRREWSALLRQLDRSDESYKS